MSAGKVDTEPAPGVYAPRRSQHVSSNLAQSDGDIWQEKFAVCEGATPEGDAKLLIRSFYRNTRTKDRVWDEPPSGAGTVLHATSQMRNRAETQKQELQLTLEMIPPDDEGNDDELKEKAIKGKKGLFGRFRKKKAKKQVETAKDLNLQRAIARSMADQNHGGSDDPIVYYDGESSDVMETANGEDDDLALAKALSMSESASRHDNGNSTEEEMFQRALEQSRMESRGEATGVASMPTVLDESESYSSFTMPSETSPTGIGKSDFDEDLDRKLPAIP